LHAVVDANLCAVAKSVLAGVHDHVANVEPAGDLDDTTLAAAKRHEDLLDGVELFFAFGGLFFGWLEAVDVVAVEAGDDGCLRNRNDVLFSRQLDANARELTRVQLAFRIGDLRA